MLQISNLSFAYRNEEIFEQANAILLNTSIVVVVGDNGSGKTTLLKILVGELRPDDGAVKVDGIMAYLPQSIESLSTKSGGERTRLALEQVFAQNCDVMLLDEPTNNLDSEAKLWLREKLLAFDGLVLLVSHDREFINQVAEAILEVKDHKLNLYTGNYDDYVARLEQAYNAQKFDYDKARKATAKAAERLKQTQAHSNQIDHSHFNKLRDENAMAFRSKRSQAQSTAGKIIRATKTELARLQAVQKPPERKTYQSKIAADFLRRRRLLAVENLAKSYDGRILFQDLNVEIYTGERCRVMGGNGAGKTTLFKIILGEILPDQGAVKLAPNLKVGYIAQDVYGLDLSKSFLAQNEVDATEIFRAAATMDLEIADLKVPCGELSRGQLTKLAFLKIIVTPADLLILDEPTNHLDIRARENIENALMNYPGAILLATHDEKFAEKVGREGMQLV